jgi:transcriptional regulator PpsR
MPLDFKDPELLLANTDARMVGALVSTAADLTLVLDGSDIIKDLSHNLDRHSGSGIPAWRGLPIDEVVRTSSRQTMREALRLARDGQRVGRFDISHVLDGGRDLPMQYSALGIGSGGRIVLMGRDVRSVSELQSRLLASRQSIEQNAKGQKQAEAHYRLLFETASDAIVMVDAVSGKVREANPRAAALLGIGSAGANGKKFASLFDKSRQADIKSMLSGVLMDGSAARLRIDRAGNVPIALTAELFRAGDLKLTMVRIAAASDAAAESTTDNGIETLVRDAAEAIVLTDDEGRVLWANESFLVLAALPLAAHALGKPFEDFLQLSGVERDVLYANVRRHGRVPTFSGTVRGANGQTTEVDLSAVAMREGPTPGYGFVMRALDAEGVRRGRGNSDLMRTAEKLVEMIGRVPMKDLVRDTTDVIERMCIEAALKLTGNNRASTARVLGLSRQALYLKMNRFGIADSQ